MNRRTFLKLSLVSPVATHLTQTGPSGWRTFEIRVKLEIQGASGGTRAWIPLPLARETSYQRNAGHTWAGNASSTGVLHDPAYSAAILLAEWSPSHEIQGS